MTRISQNIGIGNLILTALAQDVDSGDRGRFEFYLGLQTSTTTTPEVTVEGSTQYDIDADRGNLTAKLDPYTPGTYELSICARDFGTPSETACALYTIIIEPANNDPPSFELRQGGIIVLVPELTEETVYTSVPVFIIQVIDADDGKFVVYILLSCLFTIVCLQVQLDKLKSQLISIVSIPIFAYLTPPRCKTNKLLTTLKFTWTLRLTENL